MTTETKMQDWLSLFDDNSAAMETTRKLERPPDLQIIPLGGHCYLTARPPVYRAALLCTDDHWRKWDIVAKLAAIG